MAAPTPTTVEPVAADAAEQRVVATGAVHAIAAGVPAHGEGDDILVARDAALDVFFGGRGNDTAIADDDVLTRITGTGIERRG